MPVKTLHKKQPNTSGQVKATADELRNKPVITPTAISNEGLPDGWRWVRLGDVCEVITGTTPPRADPKNYGNDIPFFKPPHLWDTQIYETDEKLSLKGAENARIVPPNTVLVTCIGNLGRTGFVKTKAAFNQQINAIAENENIDGKYIFYQAQSPLFKRQLERLATGTTVSIVNKGNFETIEIPLAPKNDQHAIVSKIEELLSELDKGKQQLETAQQQLKIYRQAVLKWAFEGKLTHKEVKEGELPIGWSQSNLGDYIEHIGAGKSYKCDERPPRKNEIGIVKVSSVTWGFFDEMESKTCYSNDLLNRQFLIKSGDFLFSRANTIELIGACVIVNKIEKELMLSDKILRFTFKKEILKEYVLHYLRSKKGRKEIEEHSTGNQDSMRNIGQSKIKLITIPVPLIDEQQKIVQEIESRLSVCDKVEETITTSLQQTETLRQSILKKAFEGKLVYKE